MTAAIYSRISKDREETNAGVDRQEADCHAILAREGIRDPLLFRDNDRSAWQRDRKRPAWDELLAGIRSSAITTLAVWHPDRLMRQPRDLEDLIDAADRGLRVLSAGGGRDLGNPDDRYILRIETASACKASDDTSRRTRRGLEARAARGMWHSTRPFGIAPDGTLDVEAAGVLRDAAAGLLGGRPWQALVAGAEASGVRPPRGGAWTVHSLRGMLTRPSAAGLVEHQGRIIGPTAYPAVLDEGTWRAVRALVTDPSRRASTSSAYAHLLTGLLHCGRCDAGMRGLAANARHAPRYACGRCFGVSAVRAPVDAYVTAAVDERLRDAQLPAPMSPNGDLAGELAALRTRRQAALREFADDETVTHADLRVILDRLDTRIGRLERRLTRTTLPAPVPDGWQTRPLAARRAVIGAVLDRAVLEPAGRLGRREFDPARITLTWR